MISMELDQALADAEAAAKGRSTSTWDEWDLLGSAAYRARSWADPWVGEIAQLTAGSAEGSPVEALERAKTIAAQLELDEDTTMEQRSALIVHLGGLEMGARRLEAAEAAEVRG